MAYTYYDVQRNWRRKIVPHLDDPAANVALRRDFGRYLWGLWEKEFTPGTFPFQYENCDWHLFRRRPHPQFWRYVKHGACFWVVNFNFHLARLAEPSRPWRIMASEKHATVWDRHRTYFDMNFLALGVDPFECHQMARVGGRELGPGEEYECGYPEFWRDEVKRHQEEREGLRRAPAAEGAVGLAG